MSPTAASAAGGRFCVIVHDVTPVFAAQIDHILDQCGPLVEDRLVGAVVPQWHGREPGLADRHCFCRWAKRLGEMALHGWTHFRESRRGPISWLTGGSDEFNGMSRDEAVERVHLAQSLMTGITGTPPRGFVPPAWSFPAGIMDIRAAGIEYVIRFGELELGAIGSVPLATWSWDWGWLPGTRRAGACLGAMSHLWSRRAVPTIVLHPRDVQRRCLPAAIKLIRRFLKAGWTPVLPSDLARGEALRGPI